MKMTDIVKVVQTILDGGGSIDTHDPAMMANIYAGQCLALNDRLKACVGYLQRGMNAQAIATAHQEPPLIALCEEMGRLETAGWPNMCREKGWQIPVPLNRDALSQLRTRLETEVAIAPLLKKLRQANNLSNAGQCTAILREITKADPGNSRWKEQLIAFEIYRLQQVPAELERLQRENDLNGLAKLIIELKQEWITPVDAALVSHAESFVREALVKQLQEQEKTIIENINAAYGAKDVQLLGEAFTAWKHLEKSRYFKADNGLKPVYDKALNWYRRKVREFNEQKVRSQTLSLIEEKIAQNTDQGLKELWEKLKGFDEPLPKELEDKIQTVMAVAKEARHRAQRRRKSRNALLMAAVGLCLVLFFIFYHYKGIKEDVTAALDQAFLSQDIAEFNAVVESMESEHGLLFSEGDIQQQRVRSEALKDLLEQKRVAFQTLILRLEEMQRQGFVELFVTIEMLFKKAQENIKALDTEQRQRLVLVQNLWQQKKLLIKAADEKELALLLTQLKNTFDGLLHSPPKAGSRNGADIQAQFQTIELLLTKADKLHMPLIADAMKEKLLGFSTRFETMKSNFKVRAAQLTAIENADTLKDYLKALKSFAAAFPDDPVTPALEPVIHMAPIYEDLVADPEQYDPDNSFWAATADNIKALKNNIAIHQDEVQEDLKRMERSPRFTDLWQCTVKKPNRKPEKWYFRGEPTREYVDGILSYSGIAYALSHEDTAPEFQLSNVITVHVENLQKMPHCQMVQQMIDHIAYDIGVESIIREMQHLYRQNTPPILKLRLMEFLVNELLILTGRENALSFAAMADDFKTFKNEVNWLCTTHRKYQMESRRADAILKSHFRASDIAGNYLARQKLQNISLKRLPRWIGFVDLEDGKGLHLKTGRVPGELWVVRGGDAKKPHIFVTQEKSMGQYLKYLDHKGYLPGEPLFAPYDRNTTREVVDSVFNSLNFKKEPEVQWPASWPLNVRDANDSMD